MKNLILITASFALLASCSQNNDNNNDSNNKNNKAIATIQSDQPNTSATSASRKTPSLLGINLANMDNTIRPQDDLYRYVGGTWLKTFKIPADRSNYGSFTRLAEESQKNLKGIIEEAAATKAKKGTETQKVGDFYRAFMDTKNIEQKGLSPLKPLFAKIAAIKTKDDVISAFVSLGKIGIDSPVGFFVNQDRKDSTKYISYLWQAGISMPNRDYYLKDDAKSKAIQQKFVQHITTMFNLADIENAKLDAENIFKLETKIAKIQWDRVDLRNPDKTYNIYEISKLKTLAPNINWQIIINDIGLLKEKNIIVSQPSYIKAFNDIFLNTSVADWKNYLRWHLLSHFASSLSEKFATEDFNFFRKTLSGVEQQQPRWKRAVNAISGSMGEIVGKIYVERYFKPEAKKRMVALVENLRKAFAIEIAQLDWMSPKTKAQAQEKLRRFTTKIGYPDKWKDYSALEISADDLLQNNINVAKFVFQREINKLGKPVDRSEWRMTPQTVNAYYNPPMNEIVFPAAILQPPFFNMQADDAVNYGGIGAVIGHEMSHGFDDRGRKTDANGNLRDWWTKEDSEKFDKRAAKLAAFYSKFTIPDGKHVKGKFTLGENIADLGGLTIAFKAYQMSLDGKEAPIINGFSGAQRFYMGWAQVWARKYRSAELDRRILTDPHSPSEFRANGPIQHIDDYYKTFNLKEGDKLYLKPEDRIKIW